jgi:hypothetical protein
MIGLMLLLMIMCVEADGEADADAGADDGFPIFSFQRTTRKYILV